MTGTIAVVGTAAYLGRVAVMWGWAKI